MFLFCFCCATLEKKVPKLTNSMLWFGMERCEKWHIFTVRNKNQFLSILWHKKMQPRQAEEILTRRIIEIFAPHFSVSSRDKRRTIFCNFSADFRQEFFCRSNCTPAKMGNREKTFFHRNFWPKSRKRLPKSHDLSPTHAASDDDDHLKIENKGKLLSTACSRPTVGHGPDQSYFQFARPSRPPMSHEKSLLARLDFGLAGLRTDDEGSGCPKSREPKRRQDEKWMSFDLGRKLEESFALGNFLTRGSILGLVIFGQKSRNY